MKRLVFMLVCGVALLGATVFTLSYKSPAASTPTPVAGATHATPTTLANPASVFCTSHGGTASSTAAIDGGQQGICSFPSGASCDEWALFRGECDVEGVSTSGAFSDGSTTIRMVYRTEGSFLTAASLGLDHLDMTVATSASGARYLSADGTVEFWEHQGSATIRKNDALLFDGTVIDQTTPAAGD